MQPLRVHSVHGALDAYAGDFCNHESSKQLSEGLEVADVKSSTVEGWGPGVLRAGVASVQDHAVESHEQCHFPSPW